MCTEVSYLSLKDFVNTDYDLTSNNVRYLKQESITASDNSQLTTSYEYPLDFPSDAIAIEMVQRNQLASVWTRSTVRGSTPIGVEKTVFDYSTHNHILPKESLLSTSNSLALIKNVDYDRYDNKGRLIQFRKRDGIPISLVWDFNDNLSGYIIGKTIDQITPHLSGGVDGLRSIFPDALIYSYDYYDGIGMKCPKIQMGRSPTTNMIHSTG